MTEYFVCIQDRYNEKWKIKSFGENGCSGLTKNTPTRFIWTAELCRQKK
jgi:hypothetical protein